MFVVAIVNRKGGCGKSTLATHLAAHFARGTDSQVLLGDLDRQQSATAWLRLREERDTVDRDRLRSWPASARTLVRPTTGATHLVLDTPGGLEAMELARVVMAADVVLLPLRESLFDRLATEQSVAELRRLPRVTQGRCRVAALGMGVSPDQCTPDSLLAQWAQDQTLPLPALLTQAPAYSRTAEKGLCLFDTPTGRVRDVLLPQWEPLLSWLGHVERETRRTAARRTVVAGTRRRGVEAEQGATSAAPTPQPSVAS